MIVLLLPIWVLRRQGIATNPPWMWSVHISMAICGVIWAAGRTGHLGEGEPIMREPVLDTMFVRLDSHFTNLVATVVLLLIIAGYFALYMVANAYRKGRLMVSPSQLEVQYSITLPVGLLGVTTIVLFLGTMF